MKQVLSQMKSDRAPSEDILSYEMLELGRSAELQLVNIIINVLRVKGQTINNKMHLI